MQLTPNSIIDGKYRVERVLGQGGMGIVVHAHHLDLDAPVALKFLLPDAAAQPELVERFIREARAVRKLTSPNVVKVLDVGRLSSTGAPYMTMELLDGSDLADMVERNGPLSVEEACSLMIQACDAIAEAHSFGIIHRDIKPSNLFKLRVSERGGTSLKVLDFGIAKVMDASNATQTHAVIGSVSYMSPEQLRSAKYVDGRTDIWSLGVTLYQLLTGALPFEGESLTEIILAITTNDPMAIEQWRVDIPENLRSVVMRCLEKHPDRRYSTAWELAMALAPFVGKEVGDFVTRSIAVRSNSYFPPSSGSAALALLPTVQQPAAVAITNSSDAQATTASRGSGSPAIQTTAGSFVVNRTFSAAERPGASASSSRFWGVIAAAVVGVVGIVVVGRVVSGSTAVEANPSSHIAVSSPAVASDSLAPTVTSSTPPVASSVPINSSTAPSASVSAGGSEVRPVNTTPGNVAKPVGGSTKAVSPTPNSDPYGKGSQ